MERVPPPYGAEERELEEVFFVLKRRAMVVLNVFIIGFSHVEDEPGRISSEL